MTDHPLHILLNADMPPDLLVELQTCAPAAVILRKAEIDADPALIHEIDIIYGGISQEQWAQATRLQWVQTTWAGMEGMLTPEAKAHPAVITNARIHAEPITEHLFGMLLALTRGLHLACRQQPTGAWDSSAMRAEVQLLSGKTLGILGLGTIGRRVAEIGQAFGMRILGMRRHPQPTPPAERVYPMEEKLAMLAQCDVIVDLLPLTPATRHFMDAAAFSVLKPTAILLNAGRGATVDTTALVQALRAGQLHGAALDVTDPEPLPADHPLWTLPHVIITPHYAGSFPGYAESAARLFLKNLARFLHGQPLLNIVDKQAGY